MIRTLKRRLYFVGAWYFAFWARLKLARWKPRVIVVTGSAGKTTLLHLIEAQLGEAAHYSHHANSAYGIPFDILGLPGVQNSRADWLKLFLAAPFKSLSKPYAQKLYVAEVDADRPHEGKFLARLLKPEVTLWVSTLHTHTAQFDRLVGNGRFRAVEDAVSAEYGHLLAATKELVVINGDSERMVAEAKRSAAPVRKVLQHDLMGYDLRHNATAFSFGGQTYTVPTLQPRTVYYQVAMVDILLKHLRKQADPNYVAFHQPPGRSNVFAGINGTTLIDSTYNNSNVDSLVGVVELFEQYPAKQKWLVLSDMIEQGNNEAREHAKIAPALEQTHFDHIILMGPRLKAHTAPLLDKELRARTDIIVVDGPKDVLDVLQRQLKGGEAVAFKGVRFLEGVIEKLLADPGDRALLVRREPMWQRRRAKWGL
jgi:UDP-N-acetylmuramyl pentapeptide synthase